LQTQLTYSHSKNC